MIFAFLPEMSEMNFPGGMPDCLKIPCAVQNFFSDSFTHQDALRILRKILAVFKIFLHI